MSGYSLVKAIEETRRAGGKNWGKAEFSPCDFYISPGPLWVEVRFIPSLGMPLHKLLPAIVALFEEHYDLREEDGEKVFLVYSSHGKLTHQCALFIKQRPGGRPVPQLSTTPLEISE